MKSARSLALALAFSGLGATGALAQYGAAPGYPSTGRYCAPALLPLPTASGPWVNQTASSDKPAASSSEYVSPVANYVPQPAGSPVVIAAPRGRHPAATGSPSLSPDLSYTAIDQPPPPSLPNGPPGVPGEVIVTPAPDMAPGMAPGMFAPNAHDVPGAMACGCAGSDCWAGDCGLQSGHSWYGYVGGLVMGRDRSNKFWTTFETGNNANQLMYFPGADWGGGFETTIGFAWSGCDNFGAAGCASGCGDCNSCGSGYRHGIEATYWGVWGLDAEDSRRSETNQLSSPLDLGFVNVPTAGLPASVFFDNAREHRLSRDGQVQNVEINLVDFITPTYGRDVQFQWLVGARFFKFDEFLQFASVSSGNEFGSDGGLNEAYLDLDVENNLIGAQIGGRADWRVHRAWRVFAGTKVGVFANDINFDTRLSRGDGALATFESTGNTFDLHAHETDVSLLAQIDLGLAWDFSRHWSANIGYRAVGISGLALADDQLPAFLAAEQDWTDIDSNGSMILHGGFAGLEFRY